MDKDVRDFLLPRAGLVEKTFLIRRIENAVELGLTCVWVQNDQTDPGYMYARRAHNLYSNPCVQR